MHVVEGMKDGSYIVSIDGVKYRAFQEARVRQFALDRTELLGLRSERDKLTANEMRASAIARKFQDELASADAETLIEAARADKFKTMYERENALRLNAEALKQPKFLFSSKFAKALVVVAAVTTGAVVGYRLTQKSKQ